MKSFQDKVVAITGAGSGIGKALACALAERGARLALSDVDEAKLSATVAQVQELCASASHTATAAGRAPAREAKRFAAQPRVHSARVDVSQKGEVFAWADAVTQHFGQVNVIINNAGVALTAPISGVAIDDIEWLMSINFWGVVHGTKAFLPHLIASGEGHVVNMSSVFGIVAIPTQSAYNAAKAAVKGFTEALRMEMLLEEHPVGVTCVHPGGILTNIAQSARHPSVEGKLNRDRDRVVHDFEKTLAINTPEYCAQAILRGVERNAPRLIIGRDARILDWAARFMPLGFQSLLVGSLKRRWGKDAAVNQNAPPTP